MMLNNIVMYRVIFLFFLLFSHSCGRDGQKCQDIEGLLELDRKVRAYLSLTQFNSFKLSRKMINNVEVCDALKSRCSAENIEYTKMLEKLEIPANEFDFLVGQMDEYGYKAYHRYGDYSIWVINGAFGDIHGHLINHNPAIKEIKPFKINNRYYVGVGKKIGNNVYYFSSNYY